LRLPWRYGLIAIDFLSALAFVASFKLFGKRDGWVGVFEKTR
jgi:hypothetical protein